MHFGENREEIRTGSEETPEPVHVEMIALYEIFQVFHFFQKQNETDQC